MNTDKLKTMALGAMLRGKCREKDPQLWIFSSTDNVYFNYNSRYLFLYVKEHLPQITPRYVMNDPEKRAALAAEYGAEYFIDTTAEEGILTALKGGVWFTSAGLPVYGMHLRQDRMVVNLWHGVPLKKIALLDPSLGKAGRIYFRKIFSENYTDIVTTSPFLAKITAESFDVPEKRIRVWGQPRNDLLFGERADLTNYSDFENEITGEAAKGSAESGPGRKYILYAPTFRTGRPIKLFPFDDYDKEKLDAFLETHHLELLIRTHLEEKEKPEQYLSEHVRFFNEDVVEDIMEALNGFDLLITDYSSIYIDYLLLNRPEIFLPYDLQEYESEHGFNFDYETMTPGPKPKSMEKFLSAIEEALEGEDSYRENRISVNDKLNEIQQPCAELICKKILRRIEKMTN